MTLGGLHFWLCRAGRAWSNSHADMEKPPARWPADGLAGLRKSAELAAGCGMKGSGKRHGTLQTGGSGIAAQEGRGREVMSGSHQVS
jgi:hypothetical protein